MIHVNYSPIIISSGLAFDYSFWNVPVNNSQKCYNGEKSPEYTYARQCFTNITKEPSTLCTVGDYCPNTSSNISFCPHFFCPHSKTCVEEARTCDGICHCYYCEDETFDKLCEHTFPEAATIKCYESDRPVGINITILAIPCNGVRECKYKNDEDCESKLYISLVIMAILFAIICIGWFYIHFTTGDTDQSEKGNVMINLNNKIQKHLKGDDLARFKVLLKFYINCNLI